MKKSMMMASAALFALALSACGAKTEQAADQASNITAGAIDTTAAISANAVEDVKQAIDPTPVGQDFANIAGKSDAYEIAAAKLALTNAASKEVKDFANEMIKAHTDSTAKIKAAGAKASPAITPDATLTADQNDDLADLAKKKGADFDKAYIDDQVDAHEDALALLKDYAANGDTPSLKAAAAEIVPAVEKHLDHARMLDK